MALCQVDRLFLKIRGLLELLHPGIKVAHNIAIPIRLINNCPKRLEIFVAKADDVEFTRLAFNLFTEKCVVHRQ